MSSIHIKLTMPAKVVQDVILDVTADQVKKVEKAQREMTDDEFAFWAMSNLRTIFAGDERIEDARKGESHATNQVWHK